MASPRISNIHAVSLDGVDYGTKVATLESMGGNRKESQYASGKRTGVTYAKMASRISVTFEANTETDYIAIRDFSGPVTFRNDIGQVFNIPNCDVMEGCRLLPNGGGVECVIEGDDAEPAL